MTYKTLFESLLLEENPQQVSDRPRHDRGGDESLEPFLDKDTDPKSLNPEGMPEGAMGSLVEKVAGEIIANANKLKEFAGELIDPNNPNAILTRLASEDITSIPEFQDAAEQAAKSLQKAQPAIQQAVTAMNVLATLAKNRRDARVRAESEAPASGPR